MPGFFDNKVLFADEEDVLVLTVKVYLQPSITRIYVNHEESMVLSGNVEQQSLGTGARLKGQKIRIHTAVQDKLDNTDEIRVMHLVEGVRPSLKREIATTASDESEVFDIFTDITVV